MTAAAAAVKNPSSRSISAAMAGDELARILGAEMALDRGFEQVAGLRDDRRGQRHKDQHRGDDKPARA